MHITVVVSTTLSTVAYDGIRNLLQLEVGRPECLAEFRERVAAPHVIDQNVQSLVPPLDPSDQLFHIRGLSVIDSNRNAAPARSRNQFSSFFDSFRPARSSAPSP